MGAHDLAMKALTSNKAAAADIVNSLCCDGEEVVKPGDIIRVSEQTTVVKGGQLSGQSRDVFYRIEVADGQSFDVFYLGFEHQTTVDRIMPVRVMGYNYGDYREFVENHPNEPLPPIITLVLYFGKNPWTGPSSLHEMMNKKVREKYKEWVSDYKIRVIDLGRLTNEEICKFRGTFRNLAKVCTWMCNKDYPVHHEPCENLEEVLPVVEAMGGPLSEEMLASIKKGDDIVTIFDVFYADQNNKLKIRVEHDTEQRLVAKMLSKGMTPEEISEVTDIPLDQILIVQSGFINA